MRLTRRFFPVLMVTLFPLAPGASVPVKPKRGMESPSVTK